MRPLYAHRKIRCKLPDIPTWCPPSASWQDSLPCPCPLFTTGKVFSKPYVFVSVQSLNVLRAYSMQTLLSFSHLITKHSRLPRCHRGPPRELTNRSSHASTYPTSPQSSKLPQR